MISALLAVDKHGGMGYQGTLPWYFPADLKRFQQLTKGHIVVMGRKTWDDPKMPKPLEGRTTYIVTSRPETLPYYAKHLKGENLNEELLALEQANPKKKIFVIGGPQIILDSKDVLDRIYLTHINDSFKIDTRINLHELLIGTIPVACSTGPKDPLAFLTYENIFKRSE